MSNLTRYEIVPAWANLEAVLVVRQSESGIWIKFDDIKELLNSSHNSAMDAIAALNVVIGRWFDTDKNELYETCKRVRDMLQQHQ